MCNSQTLGLFIKSLKHVKSSDIEIKSISGYIVGRTSLTQTIALTNTTEMKSVYIVGRASIIQTIRETMMDNQKVWILIE